MKHTVAAQQTLTSYRCPGTNPSSRNHDSVPLPLPPALASRPAPTSVSGKEAFNFVRRIGVGGDKRSRSRSERSGLNGFVEEDREGESGGGGGPRKMVFSTLALARGRMMRIMRRKLGRRDAMACIVGGSRVVKLGRWFHVMSWLVSGVWGVLVSW